VEYTLVPVPSEYVLDVMRFVLFRAPDEEGHSSGRDAGRVESLLAELDDFERSVLVLIANSVGKDDSLVLRDAAAELGVASQDVSECVRAINQKAYWGKDVIALRPETGVGARGRHHKFSILTMSPEIARWVRVGTRALSAPDE